MKKIPLKDLKRLNKESYFTEEQLKQLSKATNVTDNLHIGGDREIDFFGATNKPSQVSLIEAKTFMIEFENIADLVRYLNGVKMKGAAKYYEYDSELAAEGNGANPWIEDDSWKQDIAKAKGGKAGGVKWRINNPIKTKADVEAFFMFLLADDSVSFHPDDDFGDYVNYKTNHETYTLEEAALRNKRMNEAFDVMKKADADIYDLAIQCTYKHDPKLQELMEGKEKKEKGGEFGKGKLNWRLGIGFPKYYYGYNNGGIYATQENNITPGLQIKDIELVFPVKAPNFISEESRTAALKEMKEIFPELSIAEVVDAIHFDKKEQGGHIGFKNLSKKVAKFYEEKGSSKEQAKEIGNRVAGYVKKEMNAHYAEGGKVLPSGYSGNVDWAVVVNEPYRTQLEQMFFGAPDYHTQQVLTPAGDQWFDVRDKWGRVEAFSQDISKIVDFLKTKMEKGGPTTREETQRNWNEMFRQDRDTELKSAGFDVSTLTPNQKYLIAEPSEGPENFYADGERKFPEALAFWKRRMAKEGLSAALINKAVEYNFGDKKEKGGTASANPVSWNIKFVLHDSKKDKHGNYKALEEYQGTNMTEVDMRQAKEDFEKRSKNKGLDYFEATEFKEGEYAKGGGMKVSLHYPVMPAIEVEFEKADPESWVQARWVVKYDNLSKDFPTEKEAEEEKERLLSFKSWREKEIYDAHTYYAHFKKRLDSDWKEFREGIKPTALPKDYSKAAEYLNFMADKKIERLNPNDLKLVPKGTYFKFKHFNYGVERVTEFVLDEVVCDKVFGWLNFGGEWKWADYIFFDYDDTRNSLCIGSGSEILFPIEIVSPPNNFKLPVTESYAKGGQMPYGVYFTPEDYETFKNGNANVGDEISMALSPSYHTTATITSVDKKGKHYGIQTSEGGNYSINFDLEDFLKYQDARIKDGQAFNRWAFYRFFPKDKKEKGGKPNLPIEYIISASKLADFEAYIYSFYGQGGVHAEYFPNGGNTAGVSKEEIKHAVQKFVLAQPQTFYGDSIDREQVREIMLAGRGSTPSFASGGNLTGNFEIELSAEVNPDFRGNEPWNKKISPKKIKAGSVDEIKTIARKFIDDNDLGGGNWDGGKIWKDGKPFGYMSYNGRIWDWSGGKIDTLNYKEKVFEAGGHAGKYFVGVFNEQQLRDKEDKVAIEKAMKETGLKYINSKLGKKNGKQFMEVFLVEKFESGGSVSQSFTIAEMKERLNKQFPDSFRFEVHNLEKGTRTPEFKVDYETAKNKANGLTDAEVKSKLHFPSIKSIRGLCYRVYQGGENTYFDFALEDDDLNDYIGSFGFKDRGDVDEQYITRFIVFLMEQYGLPFNVKQEVFAKGGSFGLSRFAPKEVDGKFEIYDTSNKVIFPGKHIDSGLPKPPYATQSEAESVAFAMNRNMEREMQNWGAKGGKPDDFGKDGKGHVKTFDEKKKDFTKFINDLEAASIKHGFVLQVTGGVTYKMDAGVQACLYTDDLSSGDIWPTAVKWTDGETEGQHLLADGGKPNDLGDNDADFRSIYYELSDKIQALKGFRNNRPLADDNSATQLNKIIAELTKNQTKLVQWANEYIGKWD